MIRRYSREAMRQIWTEENKFSIWLQIEILACEARRIPAQRPRDDQTPREIQGRAYQRDREARPTTT